MKSKKDIQRRIDFIQMVLEDNGEILIMSSTQKRSLMAQLNNLKWMLGDDAKEVEPVVGNKNG